MAVALNSVMPWGRSLDEYTEMFDLTAGEVRIFPLLEQFGSGHSRHLLGVLCGLTAQGYQCEVKRVPYEFQKGGNEMLRVVAPGTKRLLDL